MCLPQAYNCNDFVINTSSVLKMGATSSLKAWESSVTTRRITHTTQRQKAHLTVIFVYLTSGPLSALGI